jgi:3'-phosphoadenosine 5'-phosphosulfate sulfotransferase (PAPS reductase)/FAD synthetase
MLPLRQFATNEQFQHAWQNIEDIISFSEIDALIASTLDEIAQVTKDKKVAYAWSGGKDSQALSAVLSIEAVARGLRFERCMIALADDFEFPAFLEWLDEYMPEQCSQITTNTTWAWLKKNPHMLFPNDTKLTGRWFKKVQHSGQETYFHQENLDMLILGRRRADGNYVDKGDGTGIYSNARGVTYYSPLRHWTHEQVLAACHYYLMPLPPFYEWENGWRNGTGPWPAREDTKTIANGWRMVYGIDPDIVTEAANHLPSARDFLATL